MMQPGSVREKLKNANYYWGPCKKNVPSWTISRSRSPVTETRMRSRPRYLHSHLTHISFTADHDMTHRQDNEPAFAPKRDIHDRKAKANSTPRPPAVAEVPMTVAALLEVATGALANPGFTPTAGALLPDAVATGLILFGRAV